MSHEAAPQNNENGGDLLDRLFGTEEEIAAENQRVKAEYTQRAQEYTEQGDVHFDQV